MEKKETEKKNEVKRSYNGGLIVGVLVGIIIMLVIVIALFATNTISFNNGIDNISDTDDKNVEQEEKEKEKEEDNNKFVITFKEEKKEFKNSKDEVVITNSRNIPVVTNSSNQAAADKITEYLTTISDESWKDLNRSDYTKDDMLETLPKGIGVSYTFSKKAESKAFITFEYMMSGSMGGVGWPGLWGYTFSTTTGNLLSYEDIFKDSSAREYVYNYIIDEIGNNEYYKGDLWEGDTSSKPWKEVVKDLMFSKGHYYLTDKGLKFTFDKYSLGVGALGVPEVEISYEKINSYLKEDYKN